MENSLNIYKLLDSIIPVYFLPYFCAVLIHFMSEPLRWSVYLWKQHGNKVGVLINIFFFTAFLSYALPFKMGLPIRALLLNKKIKMDYLPITSLLAIDGIIYYAFWAISAVIALTMLSLSPSDFKYSSHMVIAIGIFSTLLILILLFKIFSLPPPTSTKQNNNQYNLIQKIRQTFSKSFTNIRQLDAKSYSLIGIITTIDITSHIARHWALLGLFDAELSVSTIAIITCISIFAGLISMMPMGLGGYDLTIVVLLNQASVPIEISLAIPVLNRIGNIAVSVIFGISSGFSLRMNPFNLNFFRREKLYTESDTMRTSDRD